MNTLYDSDRFAVLHLVPEHPADQPASHPALVQHGFEIVDKRAGKELYLHGLWAELFQQHIMAWQANTPSQEEVEDTLAGFAALAQTPVSMQ